MAARSSRSSRENGKWQVVAGLEICPPHRRDRRRWRSPARRPGIRGMQTSADPSRPPRARHVQQLRRRRDAVGHLAHLRGEHPRLLQRQAAGRASRGAQSPALWRADRLVRVGQIPRPLQCRQGAERAEPLRLGRRDRSVRSDLDAEEAHRARPRQARRRRRHHQQGRPLRRLYPATTSASTTSTASSPRRGSIRANRRANRDILDDGVALGRALQRRRHARLAAAGARPGAADRGQRLHQPGRCADREAPRRATCSAPPRWTGRRTSRPVR